jgi:hypothetical protein
LQRHYGGDPVAWFESVPLRLLYAYATMLPRLRAEESMRRVTEMQVGEGKLTEEATGEIWDAWRDAAEPGRQEELADPFYF